MQQISSRTTFFNKRIFPLVWFGFLGIFVVIILFTKNGGGSSPLIMLLVPVFMAGIGILVMKKLVWDLADQVLDPATLWWFVSGVRKNGFHSRTS